MNHRGVIMKVKISSIVSEKLELLLDFNSNQSNTIK